MFKQVFLFIALVATLPLYAANNDITVTNTDKARIISMLQQAKKQPKTTNWMIYFGKQFLGQPYVGGTLDRADEEKLVVNISEVDCTTYVEALAALTKCAEQGSTSFDDYCKWLRKIRYIGGEVSYIKRQHYFNIWMDDNQREGIVQNIETTSSPFTGISKPTINWMTTHSSNYKMLTKHPEWKTGIRNLEKTIDGKAVRYIPKALLKPTKENNAILRKYIKDGDIIALITNKKGLDTSHITMACWHSDGLHVMHASSLYKKVVDDSKSLYEYMQNKSYLVGIRICRVK